MSRADAATNLIETLVSSYFELPVRVDWKRASGLPLPDQFDEARMELAGIATAWMNLERVSWLARRVRFLPDVPARIRVTEPRVEIAVGKRELTQWLKRFELPYRLEMTRDAIVIHTELAGLPVAEVEARLAVVNGAFVLQPMRASLLGVPNYLAPLFRVYLPLPPLSDNTRLEGIEHGPDQLRLTFALEDFEERVTPGLLARLQRRLMPVFETPFANMLGRDWSGWGRPRGKA